LKKKIPFEKILPTGKKIKHRLKKNPPKKKIRKYSFYKKNKKKEIF
jgi:hypothetical protein